MTHRLRSKRRPTRRRRRSETRCAPHCGRPTTVAIASIVALLAVAAFGCRQEARAPQQLEASGTQAAARALPDTSSERLVSVVPSATELLFALGVGDRLVARSAHSDTPREVAQLPSIGSGMSPDVERILALEPDLIVGSSVQEQLPFVEVLRRAGHEVLLLDDQSLDAIRASTRELGGRLGVSVRAIALVERADALLRDLAQATADRAAVETLFVVDRDPLYAAGPTSFLGELAGAMAVENALEAGDWVQVDRETLIAADPDAIVETQDGATDPGFWARHQELSAVREGRICAVSDSSLSRPGLRVVDGARAVARCLHPGLSMGLRGSVYDAAGGDAAIGSNAPSEGSR